MLAIRDGRAAAVHYGSPAGELAACLRGVGWADRSDLVKLDLQGPPERVAAMVARVAGQQPAPGGTTFAGGGWWCAERPGRTIVLAEPDPGRRLRARLVEALVRHPDVSLRDRSDDWAALAVLGGLAPRLLARLGVYGESGDARRVPPFHRRVVGGVQTLWLLRTDRLAITLMDAAEAAVAWRAVERAGRPLGICAVGRDAMTRYALIDPAG